MYKNYLHSPKDKRKLIRNVIVEWEVVVLESGEGNNKLKEHQDVQKLKVQLGWLYFDDEKQTFVPVRTGKVGGTQEVDIKLSAGQMT